MRKLKIRNSNIGFTLIEVIVATAVFAIAIGAVSSFVITMYRRQSYTFQQSAAIDEARKGIETMVRELREAKAGNDGSYMIEKAEDHEIIFYSDVDKDGDTEKIRYFVFASESENQDCVAYTEGGFCDSSFPNFSNGIIDSAQVNICVEGDLNGGNEFVDIYADGDYLGTLCNGGCSQCASTWQGCTPFDVAAQAADGSIVFTADGSAAVGTWYGGFCDWQQNNHSMKAKFDFSWTETGTGQSFVLRKGITNPSGHPVEYPADQEEVRVLSRYIMSDLPIFRFFDGNGDELATPARLEDTKLIRVHLIINVNPNRPPQNFELESDVQIRNLKTNL